jgi:hypothetical protein
MIMVMSSGWRVVPIILKNILLFLGFFRFLICRVLFFAECFSTLGKVAECPKKVFGKEPFTDKMFAEYSLLSVTLGKGFAECKMTLPSVLDTQQRTRFR